jgi:hypothetical protein
VGKIKEKLINAWDDFLFLVRIKKYDHSSPFDSHSSKELEKLKAKYYELAELCLNSTDSKVIDKIIKEHSKCITAETCETCLLIEDTKYSNPDFEYPWLILARNKYLSYMQHHKLYSLCCEWQEMNDGYIWNLISNSESKTRQLIIEHQEFMVGNGNGDRIPELYEEMLNHPNFTQKDLKNFLGNGWDFDEELNQMYENKYGSKE